MLTEAMITEFVIAGLKLINCNKHIPIKFFEDHRSPASVAVYENGYIQMWFCIKNIIASESQFTWKEAVAHELVHVNQALNGDTLTKQGRFYWKGRDATDWLDTAMFSLALGNPIYYKQLPWEEEAFAKQVEFAKQIEESMHVLTA